MSDGFYIDRDGVGRVVGRYAVRQRPDQEFVETDAAGFDPADYALYVPRSVEDARAEGEQYVLAFFTPLQVQKMHLLLSLGNAAQQGKIAEVLAWMNGMEADWLADYENFKAASHGNPPHSYMEILTATVE